MNLLLQGLHKTHDSYRNAIEFQVKTVKAELRDVTGYYFIQIERSIIQFQLDCCHLGSMGSPFIKFSAKSTAKRNSSNRYYSFNTVLVQLGMGKILAKIYPNENTKYLHKCVFNYKCN